MIEKGADLKGLRRKKPVERTVRARVLSFRPTCLFEEQKEGQWGWSSIRESSEAGGD